MEGVKYFIGKFENWLFPLFKWIVWIVMCMATMVACSVAGWQMRFIFRKSITIWILLRLTIASVHNVQYVCAFDIHEWNFSHFYDLDSWTEQLVDNELHVSQCVHFSQEKLIICYVFIASSEIICLDVAINIDTHINSNDFTNGIEWKISLLNAMQYGSISMSNTILFVFLGENLNSGQWYGTTNGACVILCRPPKPNQHFWTVRSTAKIHRNFEFNRQTLFHHFQSITKEQC